MELDSATAQKIGETHANVEHLKSAIDSMNRRLDGLGCSDNKAKIDEVHAWYMDHKEGVKTAKFAILKTFAVGVASAILAIFGIKIAG